MKLTKKLKLNCLQILLFIIGLYIAVSICKSREYWWFGTKEKEDDNNDDIAAFASYVNDVGIEEQETEIANKKGMWQECAGDDQCILGSERTDGKTESLKCVQTSPTQVFRCLDTAAANYGCYADAGSVGGIRWDEVSRSCVPK